MTKEDLISLIEEFAEAAVQEHIESEWGEDEAYERAEDKTESLRTRIRAAIEEGV